MDYDELFEIPFKGFDGYSITKDGRIWHDRYEYFLKTKIVNGYECVSNLKLCSVHRLVAKVFIPNPNNYPCVNHINEDKLDNTVDNLEWVTQKMNVNKCTKKTSHSRPVLQICEDGFYIHYDSVTEAAKTFNVCRGAINRVCLGINQTSAGYRWRYYESSLYDHQIVDLSEAIQLDFAPRYYVFADGRIYSKIRKRFLSPILNASGYCYVSLCYDGKKRNWYVHRIVARQFLVKGKDCIEVNHKNSIKNDNRVENLEWVSRSNNLKHMHKNKASSTKLQEKSCNGSS